MVTKKIAKQIIIRRIVIVILVLLLGVVVSLNVKKLIGKLDNGNAAALDIYSKNTKINEELSKKEMEENLDKKPEVGESILEKEADDEKEEKKEIGYTNVVENVLGLSNVTITAAPIEKPNKVVTNIKVEALEKVTSLKLDLNTNVLSFSKIPDCSGYRIKITNLVTNKVSEVSSTFNKINIGEYLASSAKYNISVKALAANLVKNKDSDFSKTLEVDKRKELDIAKNLKCDKTVVSYDKVENAIKYEIHIKSEITGDIEVVKTEKTSYELEKLDPAKYLVKVIAIANESLGINKNSKPTNEVSIDARETLAKPEELKTASNDKVITWKKVKNAGKYIVKIIDTMSGDTKMVTVSKTKLDFTSFAKSIYSVSVQAVPSNEDMYKMSKVTEKINVDIRTKVSKVSNIVIDENKKIVSWKAPQNADSFELVITYYMNNDTVKKEKKTVTKPEVDVCGLYTEYKKLDIKINTISNTKKLKESGFTEGVCLPYVMETELLNPSMTQDYHCVLIESPNFNMLETGKVIIVGEDSISKSFNFSDLKVGTLNKKQVYFEEMSKLMPGEYTLKLEYKVKGVDSVQSLDKTFVVKQEIKADITRLEESEDIEYQIGENSNIKEYKLEILSLDGEVILEEVVLPGLQVNISEKDLCEGKYIVRFTPIISDEQCYVATKNSKFEETIEIKDMLPEEIIENAITFSNGEKTYFVPDKKPGYKFVKFIYTNEVIDGEDKYTFECNPQEMMVKNDNIQETDLVQVLYVKE